MAQQCFNLFLLLRAKMLLSTAILGRVLINPVLQTAANVRFAPKATEMVHCREFPVRLPPPDHFGMA